MSERCKAAEAAKIQESVDKDYELVGNCGKGAQGTVDMVIHKKNRKFYVIKTIKHKQVIGRDDCLPEVLIASAFDPEEHGRTIRCHFYWQGTWETRLVFDYCDSDLKRLIRQYRHDRARLPSAFFWHTMLQLAEALAYIHRHKVVHRDLKPENVFLRFCQGRYPDLVLGDFGIASLLTSPKHCNRAYVGTVPYLSPEFPRRTRISDVFALGAIIHEMVHEETPLTRPRIGYHAQFHLLGHVWITDRDSWKVKSIHPAYSRELDRLMKRMLEFDPSVRITSYQLLHALKDRAQEERKKLYRPLQPSKEKPKGV